MDGFSYTGYLKANVDVGLLELARRVAEAGKSRYRVGAVIAKQKPISLASNIMSKSHPERSPKSHCAEFRAVKKAQTDLGQAEIYIVRLRRDGTPGMSKPCTKCEELLRKEGITRAIYSTYEPPYYDIDIY